ncbi:hypothetical protein HF673_02740 [Acidithiobacillus thiooxidans]|uniref:VirB3 family type IV secretion system protein n=1 Tax=Acidithiobacillus thiooxidans TaxID=930 RepID=UPI001C074B98|nr:VirB3 family type IV secretion system protein [Acidithiobacillus thiooxidans]MBU2834725.1 hypothetical protein [Acidithiobacillus thiooxidans]
MATRSVPIHHGLLRPKLLMGGERQAVIYNFAFGFLLVMFTLNLYGILAAVVLCSIIQGVLVLLANRDTQAIEVTSRHLKYLHFYGDGQTLDAEPSIAHVQKQAPMEHLFFWLRSIFIKGKTHA